MSFTRPISCALILLAAVAAAEEPNIAQNQYSKPAIENNKNPPIEGNKNPAFDTDNPPPPVSKHRGLKIALGIVGGVAVFGAIIGIAVANSSSNNQTGYNDWGTLALSRR